MREEIVFSEAAQQYVHILSLSEPPLPPDVKMNGYWLLANGFQKPSGESKYFSDSATVVYTGDRWHCCIKKTMSFHFFETVQQLEKLINESTGEL